MPDGPQAAGKLEIAVIRTDEELRAALAIRFRVFVEEQHVPIQEEVDHYDERPGERDDVVHVLARLAGQPIGTARLLLDHPDGVSGFPHIGRVAVLAEHRGRGFGRSLIESLHEEARRRGERGVTLAAQLHALEFYERLGYVARGPVYLDAGIEHRDMDVTFEAVP